MIESFKIIEFTKYENPVTGFKIGYPSDWNVKENSEPLLDYISITPPIPQVRVGVTIRPSGLVTSLDDVVTGYEKQTNFGIINSNISSIAGNIFKTVLFTYTDPKTGRFTASIMYRAIRDDKLYFINYNANAELFPTYLPTFRKMVGTFETLEMVPLRKSKTRDGSGIFINLERN